MSGIKPIPAELLTECALLLTPTANGYSEESLTDVRVVRTDKITDFAAERSRDCTGIIMYFDCVNSFPADAEFHAGQSLVYRGETYEITEAELFSGAEPHHYRIKAGKTGGEYRPETRGV